MMKKIFFYFLFSFFFLISCASEKYSSSPVTSSINGENDAKSKSFQELYGNSMKDNLNASEITNLISSFPTFRNEAVNKEIQKLKVYLQNYLYAYEAFNIEGKNRAFKEFENSYKKIQKLRQYLNSDEDNVLNRYLVRIKTNISILESSQVTAK